MIDNNRPIFSNPKPRFSRKALNMIIIVTSILILVFSQSPRFTGEPETPTPPPVPTNHQQPLSPSIATAISTSTTNITTPPAPPEVHPTTLLATPLKPSSDASPAASSEQTSAGTHQDATPSNEHASAQVQAQTQAPIQAQTPIPAQANTESISTELETLKQVPLAAPRAPTISFENWTSSKGAKVYFAAAPGIPMLDVRITFSAGASREAPALAGTAKLTSGLLSEGSQHHSVDEIAALFESLGAEFSANAYRDMAVASLRTLTDPDYLQPALNLFAEVVGQPAFPEEALQRNLELMKLSLQHEKQSPSRLTSKAFFSGIYPEHPYGHSPMGSTESLNAIQQKHLHAFHKTFFVAKNSTIALVGAISKDEAAHIAEQVTQHLESGQRAQTLSAVTRLKASTHYHIDYPSQQTHIIIGLPGIIKQDPIHPHLYLANEIFGAGGFSSILLTEIREKRGLAYSASSSYNGMQAEGPFIIRLQTKNESATEALEVVQAELDRFITDGPTEKQLESARNHILASFPLQLSNNSSIVGHLGAIGFYDLPNQYLDHFYEKISTATLEEVHNAFKQVVKQNQLYTVTLGPMNPQAETAPSDSHVDDASAQPIETTRQLSTPHL